MFTQSLSTNNCRGLLSLGPNAPRHSWSSISIHPCPHPVFPHSTDSSLHLGNTDLSRSRSTILLLGLLPHLCQHRVPWHRPAKQTAANGGGVYNSKRTLPERPPDVRHPTRAFTLLPTRRRVERER